jgi:hypothetical protein
LNKFFELARFGMIKPGPAWSHKYIKDYILGRDHVLIIVKAQFVGDVE